MCVFVEHHRPGIFHRHVEHDEAAVAASLEESSHLRGLAIEQRCNLPHLLCVAESHDLQRDGQVHVGLGHESAENTTHLFEAHGHFAAAFLSRVSDDREIRRLHFHPFGFAGQNGRPAGESGNQICEQKDCWQKDGGQKKQNESRTKPSHANTHPATPPPSRGYPTPGNPSQFVPKPWPGISRTITPSAVSTATK